MTDPVNPLADQIAQGLNAHHDHMREHHQEHRKAEKLDFLEHLEKEGVEAIQQVLGAHIAKLDIDPAHRSLLERAINPTHQAELGAVVGILVAVGYILGSAVLAGPVSNLQIASMRLSGDYAIDPQLLAQGALAKMVTDADARDLSKDSGLNAGQFDKLKRVLLSTLPVGTVMDLLRQQKITDGEAFDLFERTGLDPQEIPTLLRAKWSSPDYGTLVAAVTQSQISKEQFFDLLGRTGIDPDYANIIFETAGQSPPPELAGRLFREGWIDETLFKKMLLESPLKNQYVDLLANLRFRFPPMRTTLKMLTDKVIEAPEAQTYLEKIGFFPQDAARLIESALKHTSTSVKNLSPSVIEKLYDVGKWDRGQADGALQALGYDATESDLLLTLVDEHKAHMQTDRAATSIGTRYISWKIDRAEASTLLDRLTVPAANRDEMLSIWDARREAQTLHLSEAFLHKAWKQNAISTADVKTRLLAMGYDAIDTDLILATDFAEVAPKAKSKDLTRADETKRYKAGIIDKATFKTRLTNAGYDPTEADQIIELVDHDVAAAAAKDAATNGA